MQTFDVTLYAVGDSPEDALEHMLFDSAESAESYKLDEYGTVGYVAAGVKVFSVQAIVHPDTIEEVSS